MQVIRDKLVLDLEPCFRYLDKDVKDCIRVVTPMVMLLEADGLDDARELDDWFFFSFSFFFCCFWNCLLGFGNE